MNLNTKELPDNPSELKNIILSLNRSSSEIEKENINLQQQIKFLQEENRLLNYLRFCRKSEKYIIPKELQAQLPLFNEVEAAKEEIDEEVITVPQHKRKKGGRKPIPDNLPFDEIIHDIPEEEKICGCGERLSRIGEEVSKKLDIIPQKIKVIKDVRIKYACKSCEGVETKGNTVKIAPVPPALIPKSMVTPGLASYIATSKFCDGLPLYRLEKIFLRHGIEISRANMSRWLIKISELIRPLFENMKKELLSGRLLNIDETRVQVLGEPGRENTTQSYMWCYKGGPPGNPVIIFKYQPTRAGEVCKDYIKGYKGYVQTDDYAGYNFIDKNNEMIHALCWAHARRKFDDVIKAAKKGSKKIKTGHAGKALSYISKLYKTEKECKEEKLSAEEIKIRRQEESVPILKEFKAWLDGIHQAVVPKSLLGKAVNYTLSNWGKLIIYVDDGHISIDNNGVENALRPFVIGRKNWLFSGSPNGADASASFYSLIETAKANGLEPYYYLRYLLEKAKTLKDESEYKKLLPQNINKEELSEFIKNIQ